MYGRPFFRSCQCFSLSTTKPNIITTYSFSPEHNIIFPSTRPTLFFFEEYPRYSWRIFPAAIFYDNEKLSALFPAELLSTAINALLRQKSFSVSFSPDNLQPQRVAEIHPHTSTIVIPSSSLPPTSSSRFSWAWPTSTVLSLAFPPGNLRNINVGLSHQSISKRGSHATQFL